MVATSSVLLFSLGTSWTSQGFPRVSPLLSIQSGKLKLKRHRGVPAIFLAPYASCGTHTNVSCVLSKMPNHEQSCAMRTGKKKKCCSNMRPARITSYFNLYWFSYNFFSSVSRMYHVYFYSFIFLCGLYTEYEHDYGCMRCDIFFINPY